MTGSLAAGFGAEAAGFAGAALELGATGPEGRVTDGGAATGGLFAPRPGGMLSPDLDGCGWIFGAVAAPVARPAGGTVGPLPGPGLAMGFVAGVAATAGLGGCGDSSLTGAPGVVPSCPDICGARGATPPEVAAWSWFVAATGVEGVAGPDGGVGGGGMAPFGGPYWMMGRVGGNAFAGAAAWDWEAAGDCCFCDCCGVGWGCCPGGGFGALTTYMVASIKWGSMLMVT